MDMFWYPDETVRAAKDLGMRISTGGIFFDLPGIGVGAPMKIMSQRLETFIKATHLMTV